jgi:SulP family sulfate permease
MTPEKAEIHGTRLPVLQGVLPIAMARVSADVIAGVTLASLAIPKVMGYTKIAGTPVITGLYTLLIPMVLFALFGSSRHLVVGADSATAAILAAGLAGMAATGSAEYVALASLLALMASAFLILARIVCLGFLADFLSRTVLVGFLTGVGIQVAFGEVPRLRGIEGGGHSTVAKLTHAMQNVNQISGAALAVAAAVLVLIVGCRRISGRIPGPLRRGDRRHHRQLGARPAILWRIRSRRDPKRAGRGRSAQRGLELEPYLQAAADGVFHSWQWRGLIFPAVPKWIPF